MCCRLDHRSCVLPLVWTTDQYAWLLELVVKQDVPSLSKRLSTEVVEAIGQMAHHAVDSESIACLLLGILSPGGEGRTDAYEAWLAQAACALHGRCCA